MPENRAYPRKPIRTSATVTVNGNNAVQANLVDVSMGGLSLLLNGLAGPLPAGSSCIVRFEVLVDGKPHNVTLAARVVYNLGDVEECRVGMQITQLNSAESEVLQAFVDDAPRHD